MILLPPDFANDPFGRTHRPEAAAPFDRMHRVQLLDEFFSKLWRGEMPGDEARLFGSGGGTRWLIEGGPCGSLERDYWKVTQERRSTITPARLLALSKRRETNSN